MCGKKKKKKENKEKEEIKESELAHDTLTPHTK